MPGQFGAAVLQRETRGSSGTAPGLQETRRTLEALNAKAAQSPLSDDERRERARLTGELDGGETAGPLPREVLAGQPEHASANFMLGASLVDRGDAAGIEPLDRAMKKAPDCTMPACELASAYFEQAGEEKRAEEYRQRWTKGRDLEEDAYLERNRLTGADEFLAHGLDGAALQGVVRQLVKHAHLKAAYLARKAVLFLPELPL